MMETNLVNGKKLNWMEMRKKLKNLEHENYKSIPPCKVSFESHSILESGF